MNKRIKLTITSLLLFTTHLLGDIDKQEYHNSITETTQSELVINNIWDWIKADVKNDNVVVFSKYIWQELWNMDPKAAIQSMGLGYFASETESSEDTTFADPMALRKEYCMAVRSLSLLEEEFSKAELSKEEIARQMNMARREIGIQYKNLTPFHQLLIIYARNYYKYNDILGPTYDFLVSRGKTPEQIIESSKRGGGEDLGISCTALLENN